MVWELELDLEDPSSNLCSTLEASWMTLGQPPSLKLTVVHMVPWLPCRIVEGTKGAKGAPPWIPCKKGNINVKNKQVRGNCISSILWRQEPLGPDNYPLSKLCVCVPAATWRNQWRGSRKTWPITIALFPHKSWKKSPWCLNSWVIP